MIRCTCPSSHQTVRVGVPLTFIRSLFQSRLGLRDGVAREALANQDVEKCIGKFDRDAVDACVHSFRLMGIFVGVTHSKAPSACVSSLESDGIGFELDEIDVGRLQGGLG